MPFPQSGDVGEVAQEWIVESVELSQLRIYNVLHLVGVLANAHAEVAKIGQSCNLEEQLL